MELWVLKYEPNVEQSKGEKWKNLAHQEKIRGVGSSENENKKVRDRHRDRERERGERQREERERFWDPSKAFQQLARCLNPETINIISHI